MKIYFLCALVCVLFIRTPCASGEDYSQSYVIIIKGAAAGEETVKESHDANGNLLSVSQHEMRVSDGIETKRMAFSTKMTLSKADLTPISYFYNYEDTGDSCEVAVKNLQIIRTLRRGARTSVATATFQPDMVILDFNVYYLYDYLLRKYDSKNGGRQLFKSFIPVVGSDIPLALTFLGGSNFESKKGVVAVQNYKIEFVGIRTGYLAADKNGRLVQLQFPAQELEVVRKDLFSEEPGEKP